MRRQIYTRHSLHEITGGAVVLADFAVRRRLAQATKFEYQIQWLGILIAIGCVLLSRAMEFQPGYIYGVVGVLTLMPSLEGIRKNVPDPENYCTACFNNEYPISFPGEHLQQMTLIY